MEYDELQHGICEGCEEGSRLRPRDFLAEARATAKSPHYTFQLENMLLDRARNELNRLASVDEVALGERVRAAYVQAGRMTIKELDTQLTKLGVHGRPFDESRYVESYRNALRQKYGMYFQDHGNDHANAIRNIKGMDVTALMRMGIAPNKPHRQMQNDAAKQYKAGIKPVVVPPTLAWMNASTLVWHPGMTAWAAAGSQTDLRSLFLQEPPPLP